MAKMKVVKAQDVAEVEQTPQNEGPQVDPKKIEELREKFDVLNAELNEKQYPILLDSELTEVLMTKLYPEFLWKGYESYAVSETYKQFEASRTGEGINAKFPVEVIEASFHFLKNHVGKGFELAVPFKQICDQFAVTIQEINKDRQSLKDISLELVSAEQGIKVEDLVEAMNKHAQSQQNQQY
jgi:hypothetical protein